MFVHAVYLWLEPELSNPQRQTFLRGVTALSRIESVEHAYVGVPADTDRPVIERSYTHALIAVFRNRAAHDLYQAHATHEQFRVDCGSFWERVLIYDTDAG